MPISQRICAKCGEPTKLMLPPGGDGPRTYQCVKCDRPDPLQSPDVIKLVDSLAPITAKQQR
jgi:hypothetical protein